jgi:hypothetical protein
MPSPLTPLRFNDLFGGVLTEWQRQSAFIDLFIPAAMAPMSIVATQLPIIQASFGRAGSIITSSNSHRSAERTQL